jgi:hypothetical protein
VDFADNSALDGLGGRWLVFAIIPGGIQANIRSDSALLLSQGERNMATPRLPSLTVALLLAIGSLSPASAGVRLGTISVGAGYGYYSGPVWAGYYPPFFYDSRIGDSFFASPIYLVPRPDKGQVSLQGSYDGAEVYLDNAYAGTAATLKKFWLAPGAYDLEVRPKDQPPKKKRIYVLTGKTLKVSLE